MFSADNFCDFFSSYIIWWGGAQMPSNRTLLENQVLCMLECVYNGENREASKIFRYSKKKGSRIFDSKRETVAPCLIFHTVKHASNQLPWERSGWRRTEGSCGCAHILPTLPTRMAASCPVCDVLEGHTPLIASVLGGGPTVHCPTTIGACKIV